jgi:hypothetical protein
VKYGQTSLERDAKQDRSQTSETKGNGLDRRHGSIAGRARGSCTTSSSGGGRMGVVRMIVVFRGGSSTGDGSRGGGRSGGDGSVGSEGIVRSTGLVRWDLSSVDEDEVGALEEVSIPLLDAGTQPRCMLISISSFKGSSSRDQACSPRCIGPEW